MGDNPYPPSLIREGGMLIDTSGNIRRPAFTLAEVLITLGIIGVVAAMTMPVIITNYQKSQTVNRLKKAYSEISQAIRMAENEYGTLDSWDFSYITEPQEKVNYFAENYLFPNIKTLKRCSPSSDECWADTYTIDGNESYLMLEDTTGRNSFIAASGYSVFYWLHGANGAGDGGWFWIDINGLQKPNKIGKDVFPFLMSWGPHARGNYDCQERKLGLFPAGLECKSSSFSYDELINGSGSSDTAGFNCKKGSNGSRAGGYCGALIMYEGWKIGKDYPW